MSTRTLSPLVAAAGRPIAWIALVLAALLAAALLPSPVLAQGPDAFSDIVSSTYLGGTDFESFPSLAVDAAGNVYLTGRTLSADFPGFTIGSRERHPAALASVSPDGRTVRWSGTIGGTGDVSTGWAIAAAGGKVYVAGSTASWDFPTTATIAHPVTGEPLPCGRRVDLFLLVLDTEGSLEYTACFGGESADEPQAMHVDPATGAVTLAGYTMSPDFPIAGGTDRRPYGSGYDAFVLRLVPQDGGYRIAWSTLLGENDDDRAYGLAVAEGRVLVTGQAGTSFPITPGAYQAWREPSPQTDTFATVLDAGTGDMLYSTYLGDAAPDYGSAIAPVPGGGAADFVVAGWTRGRAPISPGAYDGIGDAPDGDVYVVRLSGSKLVYGTYLGRQGRDEPSSLYVDAQGVATLSGVSTFSFPTTPGSVDVTMNGQADTWVARLSADGRALLYGGLVGGGQYDGMRAYGGALRAPIVPTATGEYVLATITQSNDYPISPGAAQPLIAGRWDYALTRLRIVEQRVGRAAQPVRVDGLLGGWQNVPAFMLDARNADATIAAPPAASPTPADLSGRLQMQWATGRLYVALTVRDDRPGFRLPLANPEARGDALLLEIGGRRVTLGLDGSILPRDAGIEAYARRMATGWVLEASIPAPAVGLNRFAAGEPLPFAWGLRDEDRRNIETLWSAVGRTGVLRVE